MAKLSFEQWMQKVDAVLEKKCGLSHHDLEDFCYRDAYDDGEAPSTVAREVLANQDF